MKLISSLNQLMSREQYMLNQFSNNLQANIQRLSTQPDASTDVLNQLDQQLNEALSWSSVNQVELALVDHYDDTTLITEWRRRLAEIHVLPEHLNTFYQSQANETKIDTLRTLLSRLIVDLQWLSESKRVIRFNECRMRRNIVTLFLFAFVLFFLPTILRVMFNIEFDNLRVYYIFTAASAGILGAAFSQLTSIQTRVQSATLDQVRAMSQFSYIVARSVVGAGAGLIMFYLIQSGLLNGAFFPEFIDDIAELTQFKNALATASQAESAQGVSQSIEIVLSVGTLARPAQGLSLLIVWCLLAGFSEKMIPGILNNKAKQAEEASQKG